MLTHHKIRTNLNNLNDILNPHIKLRPAPEKKPKNKSVENLSERDGVIALENSCHSEIWMMQNVTNCNQEKLINCNMIM